MREATDEEEDIALLFAMIELSRYCSKLLSPINYWWLEREE